MIVTVPERGIADVSPEVWAELSANRSFWRLVDSNIVQTEATSAGKWRLKGTCYVGRALIGNVVLEISEKFAGAFETLVSLGPLKAPKITQTPSPIAKSTGSTAILIALFVRAVRRYLAGFKKVSYVKVPDAGTIAGGRLDVTQTLRLRAKGMAHQVAFDRSVLSADLPFNRCIYAALTEVERLSRLALVASGDIAAARVLRATLGECLPSVLATRPNELAKIAAQLATQRQSRPEISDVISLAGAVLDAAGFGGSEPWQRYIERSWFVNLETFFEEAIRNVVQQLLGTNFAVGSAQDRPPLFDQMLQRYRANPDIVVFDSTRAAVAVGDAKYKDLIGWPSSSDVHELLAHAAAYHSSKAFLFFPSDGQFWCRSFGSAATGCEVWAFGITFDALVSDVRHSLETVGLLDAMTAESA
jgi:hypothetical protein